jgi:hypothetical protein
LQPAKLISSAELTHQDENDVIHVRLQNPSSTLAFMVHLRVAKNQSGEDVVPIFWDDNYISLLPGEKRELSAEFAHKESSGGTPVLLLDGWNLAETRVAMH